MEENQYPVTPSEIEDVGDLLIVMDVLSEEEDPDVVIRQLAKQYSLFPRELGRLVVIAVELLKKLESMPAALDLPALPPTKNPLHPPFMRDEGLPAIHEDWTEKNKKTTAICRNFIEALQRTIVN